MLDLPNSVFLHVHVGVTSLDNVSGGSHGEFVDSGVACPSVSDVDVSLEDLSLWLLLEEGVEVVLHSVEVCARSVAHGWEEDWALGVSVGDDAGVSGGESGVPQAEERPDLFLGDVGLYGCCLAAPEEVQ